MERRKAERIHMLRGQALVRELSEVKPAPKISANSEEMTRHFEPFMKRVETQQQEHEQRLALKREQYEEAERSQATFAPEISMVLDRLEPGIEGWGRRRTRWTALSIR